MQWNKNNLIDFQIIPPKKKRIGLFYIFVSLPMVDYTLHLCVIVASFCSLQKFNLLAPVAVWYDLKNDHINPFDLILMMGWQTNQK